VEECRQVRSALKRLDESHRVILMLREFDGLDYQTIAEMLHVKIGTVRSRLSRAREQLKNELSAYLQAEGSRSRSSASLKLSRDTR
jgi:RNA polymerase sigma-70 factor (ECF subfamily)